MTPRDIPAETERIVHPEKIFGAIDVGTNAARLKIVRQTSTGSFEDIYGERDAIRPGEGVWETGELADEVVERLVGTMRRFSALCERYGAIVGAVATSALREARNQTAILRRVEAETGIAIQVISGTEEARLICLGVLSGSAATERNLVIDIGGGSTEVIYAEGERPRKLFSLGLGGVLMKEMFDAAKKVGPKDLVLMRSYAAQTLAKALPTKLGELPSVAIGSSGTIRALVQYAAGGDGPATTAQITEAVNQLSKLSLSEREDLFEARRAEIIVGGGVILEAILKHLRLDHIEPTNRGLKEGLIIDLRRRATFPEENLAVTEAALEIGRRFDFNEDHARQVAKLSLRLFDRLSDVHGLPQTYRPLLETAALLDDIGYAINRAKHHVHSGYLIEHMDIAGFSDWERLIVARTVVYREKSSKNRRNGSSIDDLVPRDQETVRRLSGLLRLADSLDRSHRQPAHDLVVDTSGKAVSVLVKASNEIELELWTVRKYAKRFEKIFGRPLEIDAEVA